jgi:hypothetical protein
MVMMMICFQP